MASIEGEDHRRLAELMNHRVGQLEGIVVENGRHAQTVAVEVAKVATKVDLLIDMHGDLAHRLDAHIDSAADRHTKEPVEPVAAKATPPAPPAQPTTLVGLIATHPWLMPVMLVLAAVLFGSASLLSFLKQE